MKKTVKFGKLDLYGTGRRYAAEVTIELRERGGEDIFTMQNGKKEYTGEKTPTYTELSICGDVWNTRHTDIIMGGQCLDEMNKYLRHNATFKKIYSWWGKYHLNGMNAGTPEQQAAIEEWKSNGNKYDYEAVCEYLKSIGLYTVNYTGKSVGKIYNNEPYTYGHGWIVNDIPENDLKSMQDFISGAA